jgi:hypothetical protein
MLHALDEFLSYLDFVKALGALKIVLLEGSAILRRKLAPYVGLYHSSFFDLPMPQH